MLDLPGYGDEITWPCAPHSNSAEEERLETIKTGIVSYFNADDLVSLIELMPQEDINKLARDIRPLLGKYYMNAAIDKLAHDELNNELNNNEI